MKRIFSIIFAVAAGAVMGAAAKAADVAAQGSVTGHIAWSFGLVTTGFLIWGAAGWYIAAAAADLRTAILANTGFFLGMLTAYYVYSFFVVKYLSLRVAVFWAAMIPVVAFGTVLVRRFGTDRRFKRLSIAAVVVMALTDIVLIQGMEPAAMAMELAILAFMFVMIGKENFAKTLDKC